MKDESPMSADSSSGPLIVVGMWRSGTSLLYSLLNQHPQIALMYEADLFLLQPLFSRKGSNPDWLARWEFWNSAFSRHNIRPERIPAAVPDLCTGSMVVWKEYAGPALMGEKSPNYYDCLPSLSQQFPGARFIVIWRDLSDICRSMVRARTGSAFFSKPGILHRAVIGNYKLKLGRDALLRQSVPVHEIQYEELIQDPALVMTGVCKFLGLPFDSRMTSLQGFDPSPIYEGSHHNQVKGGKILRSKECPEVLSSSVRRKIRRYVCYWHEQSHGVWPRYPQSEKNTSAAPDSDIPSPSERFCDEMLFRGLRALDRFTTFVYCYAPFGWLQGYRSLKNRRYRNTEAVSTDVIQPVREEARQHLGS